MMILGIDPGITRIGYGLIEKIGEKLTLLDYGCIELKNRNKLQNLSDLYLSISRLITQRHPEVLAIEKIFFFKNAKTVTQVSEARGVILLAALQNRLTISEFTPLQVKQAVSAYGRAQKKEVQKMVRLILGLNQDPQPDDAADALAVAICCANHTHFANGDNDY